MLLGRCLARGRDRPFEGLMRDQRVPSDTPVRTMCRGPVSLDMLRKSDAAVIEDELPRPVCQQRFPTWSVP